MLGAYEGGKGKKERTERRRKKGRGRMKEKTPKYISMIKIPSPAQ